MATTAPINFDVSYLRGQVQATYERVAQEPEGGYHFHRGPEYATDFLVYDRGELALIPRIASERFAGVQNDGVMQNDGVRSHMYHNAEHVQCET